MGLVVLAAGFGAIGEFTTADPETDREMIAVNVTAVTTLAHQFGPRLASPGRGGLILFGSIVAWLAPQLQATYAATKATRAICGTGGDWSVSGRPDRSRN